MMFRRSLLTATGATALACLAGTFLAGTFLAGTAQAQVRNEQDRVREDLAAGHVRSLREIEARVLPSMQGMQYLGPEYDAKAKAYRLKFIREGRVVFVDVDARTGQILSESR